MMSKRLFQSGYTMLFVAMAVVQLSISLVGGEAAAALPKSNPPPIVTPQNVSPALINLPSTTQNDDGSTTVFGAQGNAIQTTVASGTTVFANPLTADEAPAVPVWYAPAYSSQYFQSILNNPQLFQTVAGDIKVFKMYAYTSTWTNATFQALLAYATTNGIKLGVEAPPLVANQGQPGYGTESFATPGALIAFVSMVKQLGGALSYIEWDEPLYYGSVSTGIYTVSQLATQVAQSVIAIRAIFPDIQIGDIEPVNAALINAASLQAWFTAYAQATGTQFQSFQADVQYWGPGWQTALASAITMAHANNILVGALIDGLGLATTNAAWATQAVARAQQILSTPALRPDYLVVESWQTLPSDGADPTVAGTLASVVADTTAGESAALAIPAVAQYTSSGYLLSVAWIGGTTAVRSNGTFQLLSPAGNVIMQAAGNNVQNFSFNASTATASLTMQNQSYVLGVGANGFQVTPQ
jgi:hypothetical protein